MPRAGEAVFVFELDGAFCRRWTISAGRQDRPGRCSGSLFRAWLRTEALPTDAREYENDKGKLSGERHRKAIELSDFSFRSRASRSVSIFVDEAT